MMSSVIHSVCKKETVLKNLQTKTRPPKLKLREVIWKIQ